MDVTIMNEDKMTVRRLLSKLATANTLGACSRTVTREAARNSEISATNPCRTARVFLRTSGVSLSRQWGAHANARVFGWKAGEILLRRRFATTLILGFI
jgi:hypothetical protein